MLRRKLSLIALFAAAVVLERRHLHRYRGEFRTHIIERDGIHADDHRTADDECIRTPCRGDLLETRGQYVAQLRTLLQ